MKKAIFLLGILFFAIGVIVGVDLIIDEGNENNVIEDLAIKNEIINNNTITDKNTIVTNYSDKKVSPNASLIFKTRYKECKHIVKEVVDVPTECVNLTSNELSKLYSDWEIISFSPKEIILYREEEGICNEHYSIKQDGKLIAIYKMNSNGDEVFYRNTNIALEYLTDEDKDKLKNGIKVYSKEELSLALEDFE